MTIMLANSKQVEIAMRVLTSTEVKVKSYKIHLMEMVINAIYYNPVSNTSETELTSKTNICKGPCSPSFRDPRMDQQILQLMVL